MRDKSPKHPPRPDFPWPHFPGKGGKARAQAFASTQPGSVVVQQFCSAFYVAPSVEALCKEIERCAGQKHLHLCEAYDPTKPVKFCLDIDDGAVLELLGDRVSAEFDAWNRAYYPIGWGEFLLRTMGHRGEGLNENLWHKTWTDLAKAAGIALVGHGFAFEAECRPALEQLLGCCEELKTHSTGRLRPTLAVLQKLLVSLRPKVDKTYEERWRTALQQGIAWLAQEIRERVIEVLRPYVQLDLGDVLLASSSQWSSTLLHFKLSFHVVVPKVEFPSLAQQAAFQARARLTSGLRDDPAIHLGSRVLRLPWQSKGSWIEGSERLLKPLDENGLELKCTAELVKQFMISARTEEKPVLLIEHVTGGALPKQIRAPCEPKQCSGDEPGFAELLKCMRVGPYAQTVFKAERTRGGRILVKSDSRYCANLGGEHNSNHVYFLVSQEGVSQKCLCKCDKQRKHGRCSEFTSTPRKLPCDVKELLFPSSYPF